MPTADAGGASLYYEESGTGTPVVLVHGVPTDHRAWAGQRDAFSESGRVIALSRRYAYPNERQGDVSDSTVQNNAADLKGFIEVLDSGPVNLVGHSYGGFASALLAADHPELVRRLTLVEPAVSTFLVADQTDSKQLLGLLLKSPAAALSGRRFQKSSLIPSLDALARGDGEKAVELNVDGIQDRKGSFAGLPEETRRMMLDNARTIAELKTPFPKFTPADAAKIRCPTLIMNGDSSSPWLRKIGELMEKAIPGAVRETVPGSRHFPHIENPADFNSKVIAFLKASQKP